MYLPPLNQLSMRGRKLVSTGVNLKDVDSGECILCEGPMYSYLPHPQMQNQPLLDPRVLLMNDEDIMVWCGDTAVLQDQNRYHRRCLCDFYHAQQLKIDIDKANMDETRQPAKRSHFLNDYNPGGRIDVRLSDEDVKHIKKDMTTFGKEIGGTMTYTLQRPITQNSVNSLTENERERFYVAKAAKDAHEANERRLLQEKTDAEEARDSALEVINVQLQDLMQLRRNDKVHHDNLMGAQITLENKIKKLEVELAPVREQKRVEAAALAAAKEAEAAARAAVEEAEALARETVEEARREWKEAQKKAEAVARAAVEEEEAAARAVVEEEEAAARAEVEKEEAAAQKARNASAKNAKKREKEKERKNKKEDEYSLYGEPVVTKKDRSVQDALSELLFVIPSDKGDMPPLSNVEDKRYNALILAESWWEQVVLGVPKKHEAQFNLVGKKALGALTSAKKEYKKELEQLLGGEIENALQWKPKEWEYANWEMSKEKVVTNPNKPNETEETPLATIPYLLAPPLIHLAILYQSPYLNANAQFLKSKHGTWKSGTLLDKDFPMEELGSRAPQYKKFDMSQTALKTPDARENFFENFEQFITKVHLVDRQPEIAYNIPIYAREVRTTFQIIAAKMILYLMEELHLKLYNAYNVENPEAVYLLMTEEAEAKNETFKNWKKAVEAVESNSKNLKIAPNEMDLLASIYDESVNYVNKSLPGSLNARGKYRKFESNWYKVPQVHDLNYSTQSIRALLGQAFKVSLHTIKDGFTTSSLSRAAQIVQRGGKVADTYSSLFDFARDNTVESSVEFNTTAFSMHAFSEVIQLWLYDRVEYRSAKELELKIVGFQDPSMLELIGFVHNIKYSKDAMAKFESLQSKDSYDSKLIVEQRTARRQEYQAVKKWIGEEFPSAKFPNGFSLFYSDSKDSESYRHTRVPCIGSAMTELDNITNKRWHTFLMSVFAEESEQFQTNKGAKLRKALSSRARLTSDTPVLGKLAPHVSENEEMSQQVVKSATLLTFAYKRRSQMRIIDYFRKWNQMKAKELQKYLQYWLSEKELEYYKTSVDSITKKRKEEEESELSEKRKKQERIDTISDQLIKMEHEKSVKEKKVRDVEKSGGTKKKNG